MKLQFQLNIYICIFSSWYKMCYLLWVTIENWSTTNRIIANRSYSPHGNKEAEDKLTGGCCWLSCVVYFLNDWWALGQCVFCRLHSHLPLPVLESADTACLPCARLLFWATPMSETVLALKELIFKQVTKWNFKIPSVFWMIGALKV